MTLNIHDEHSYHDCLTFHKNVVVFNRKGYLLVLSNQPVSFNLHAIVKGLVP